jgi:hypothetical protein
MLKIVLVSVALAIAAPTVAVAGNCDHSWQTASDGSRCGDRSADSRPGGK